MSLFDLLKVATEDNVLYGQFAALLKTVNTKGINNTGTAPSSRLADINTK